MDIRTLLNQGMGARRVVDEHGRQAVVQEILEMTGDDMADVALAAAIELGEQRIVALASRMILCSGDYGPRAERLAAEKNGDIDLRKIREEILRKGK